MDYDCLPPRYHAAAPLPRPVVRGSLRARLALYARWFWRRWCGGVA